MSIRQFGVITVVVALLILLSSTYQVGAAPPKQSPSGTPEPQSGETLTVNEMAEGLPLSPPPQQNNASPPDHTAINAMAVDGHWTGTTNRARPMSFDVLSNGALWDNFKLQAPISGCSQYSGIEITLFGPGPITNDRFSGSNSARTFSFSGQFTSAGSANGTYSFVNYPIPGCGGFTQSGTWTATSSTQSGVPAQPTNLNALALSSMQILLQWADNSNNETGFKIEQSLTGIGSWTQITTTPANVTSHAPTGLTCSTTYYYRVRAYNGFGNSVYSNVASATTLSCPSPTPVAPSNLTATSVSNTQINLTWQDNSNNETGFTIERSFNSTSWAQIVTVGPNATSYANTGLTCDLTYFYRVRAYNTAGNSLYSNVASDALPCAESDTYIYLPIIVKNFSPPTPPPPGSKPVDGHWAGATSRSQPMSFDVSSNGTVLNNFKLKTDFQVGPCSGTTEITIPTSRAITNNQFSGSSGSFSFSGQFNVPTSASGTYAYVNHSIPNCGFLNQSGTWTANVP